MPKLTLPQILALARAAGHELGGPTADGAGIVAQLRAELAEARKLAEDRNTMRLAWQKDVLRLDQELAQAKRELDGARSLLSQSIDETNRLRRIIDARPPFQAFDHAAELAEARAQVAALERTVAKLRPAPATLTTPAGKDRCERCGKLVPEGQLYHDDDTDEAVCGSCPAQAPQATIDPSKVLLVRFAGAQGYGTADKLKALGARWTWDAKKPGEPRSTSGAWRVPASPEALALLEALRADGRTLTVSA